MSERPNHISAVVLWDSGLGPMDAPIEFSGPYEPGPQVRNVNLRHGPDGSYWESR